MESQKLNSFPTGFAFIWGKMLIPPPPTLRNADAKKEHARRRPLTAWALPEVPFNHQQRDLINIDCLLGIVVFLKVTMFV